MRKENNLIKIDSGKLEIVENNKPNRIMLYLTLGISIPMAISNAIQYFNSRETGYLFIASFAISLFILAILKEIYFVTYQTEIDLQKITKIRIRPILFSNEKVILDLKIGKKTRPVELRKEEANELSQKLNALKN